MFLMVPPPVAIASDGNHYGVAVSVVGDATCDGVADFAVAETNYCAEHPCLDLRSGVDGALVWRKRISSGSPEGIRLAAAGDVDRDGVPDLLVGLPWWNRSDAGKGIVTVLSGLDGHVLLSVLDRRTDTEFGQSIAGSIDFDRDGTPDIVIGAPVVWDVRQRGGHLVVASGRDGHVILDVDRGADQALGRVVATAGDIDGDGIPEIVSTESLAAEEGSWTVLSGRDGSCIQQLLHARVLYRRSTCIATTPTAIFTACIDDTGWPLVTGGFVDQFVLGKIEPLRTHPADDRWSLFGTAMTASSDVDGDGVRDVVVSAPESHAGGFCSGEVTAWSGATGQRLWSVQGGRESDLGASLAGGLDFDRDGCGDILAGAVWMNGGGDVSSVWMISGRTGTLVRKITRGWR